MTDDEPGDDHGLDFALAIHHDGVGWRVDRLALEEAESVGEVVTALRQQAPEASEVLGMISVADDFFVLVRANEAGTRLFLSDATAAHDWPLAGSVLDELGLDEPEDDDGEHVEPAGDLAIAADLGLDPMELSALCADLDLYPDEVLGSLASRIGFADGYQAAVDGGPA